MSKHTTGPWFVRTRVVDGEVVDCFVAAKDMQGLPYDAEILGDDEYRDGIDRRLADANLIAAAPELLAALELARDALLIWAPKDIRIEQINFAISKAGGELFNTALTERGDGK
jgi:hypothetical protein